MQAIDHLTVVYRVYGGQYYVTQCPTATLSVAREHARELTLDIEPVSRVCARTVCMHRSI